MKSHVTNPNIRCIYCKGRLVKDFEDGDLVHVNLLNVKEDIWICKDREECRQNVFAENTLFSFYGGDDDNGLRKAEVVGPDGEKLMEVEVDDEFFKGSSL